MICRLVLKRLSTSHRCNFVRLYATDVLKLRERGLFQDIFPAEFVPEASKLLQSKPQSIYAGFDPTADSLHIGNLLVIFGLLHFQRNGHQPVALIGGATGQVGDPSGRSTERTMLERTILDSNLKAIREQIERVFENHQKYFWTEGNLKQVVIVNNEDWYKKINSIEFITQIGKYFRMGAMLSRSSVQSRLHSETGMSFTEFCYQLCQAYDWLHLFKTFGCRFQLGGSDQMGNIHSGHDLISKKENVQAFGITLPIITNEEGDKFGKSAGKAIWLDPNKTSSYSFYQFFVRQADSEVEKLLKFFTFLSDSEIEELMVNHRAKPEARIPQKKLAQSLTLLIHGQKGLEKAEEMTAALYQGKLDAFENLAAHEIRNIFEGASYKELNFDSKMSLFDLAMQAGCFPTEKDATRIITAGGFHVNLQRIKDASEKLLQGKHVMRNGLCLLRVGKKNYHIVKFN